MKGIDIPAKFVIKRNNDDPIICEGLNMVEGANTAFDIELVNNVLKVTSRVVVNGAVSSIMDSNVTANRALVSNASGKIDVDPVIDKTELERLDNVSDNIQTQLNKKLEHSKAITRGRNMDTILSGLTRYTDLQFSMYRTMEDQAKDIIVEDVDITKITIKVNNNTTNSDSTITLRKNGADTLAVITIPADTTGVFTDEHVISLEAGDEVSFKIISGSGIAMTFGDIQSSLIMSI